VVAIFQTPALTAGQTALATEPGAVAVAMVAVTVVAVVEVVTNGF